MKSILIFFTSCLLIFNSYSQTKNDGKPVNDSNDNKQITDTTKYVPLSEFTYAGERQYTIDGPLPTLKTHIKPLNASIFGGIFLATVIALHIHQSNAWWSSDRGHFHFQEDWVSALQVDKAGHAFGGYLASYAMSQGLMASGISWEQSNIWGSVFGLAYQTYVETEDGFAKNWGFSPSDWYFDAIGPIFFLAQRNVPALQNITPKWQYIPTEWTNRPDIRRPKTFIDDYNSSTFWWSVNVYNILPDNYKKYWLPWLNIAVGYGADAIDANVNPNGPPDQLSSRRYVIGLDYNLIKLLPSDGNFWNWLRQTLNFVKLPAPTIEFENGVTRFYLLYPFRLSTGNIKF